jgi:hypothetical protein
VHSKVFLSRDLDSLVDIGQAVLRRITSMTRCTYTDPMGYDKCMPTNVIIPKSEDYAGNKEVQIAAKNYPNFEVDLFRLLHIYDDKTDEEIKQFLVAIRWANPICQCCKQKPKGNKNNFIKCKQCSIVFYCSPECETTSGGVHKFHDCMNLDAASNVLYSMVVTNRDTRFASQVPIHYYACGYVVSRNPRKDFFLKQ